MTKLTATLEQMPPAIEHLELPTPDKPMGISLASGDEQTRHALLFSEQWDAQIDPMLGQQLGAYHIIEKIGKGGFAAVYRAQHVRTYDVVAIKILHLHQIDQPDVVRRFQREARALAQLEHPSIVRMLDFGMLPQIGFYMVMELLEGENILERMRNSEQFGLLRLKNIFAQLCDVLNFVHERGIVHRDLKPNNIFLSKYQEREKLTLIDFGIAAIEHDADPITRTGAFLGTVKYTSPEQDQGLRQLDGRSDLYSMGVLLYHLITGRVPFRGDSAIIIIQNKLRYVPPLLSEQIPNRPWALELENFMQQALAADPEQRPQDARAFWQQCAQALDAQYTLIQEYVHADKLADCSRTLRIPIDPEMLSRWLVEGEPICDVEHSRNHSLAGKLNETIGWEDHSLVHFPEDSEQRHTLAQKAVQDPDQIPADTDDTTIEQPIIQKTSTNFSFHALSVTTTDQRSIHHLEQMSIKTMPFSLAPPLEAPNEDTHTPPPETLSKFTRQPYPFTTEPLAQPTNVTQLPSSAVSELEQDINFSRYGRTYWLVPLVIAITALGIWWLWPSIHTSQQHAQLNNPNHTSHTISETKPIMHGPKQPNTSKSIDTQPQNAIAQPKNAIAQPKARIAVGRTVKKERLGNKWHHSDMAEKRKPKHKGKSVVKKRTIMKAVRSKSVVTECGDVPTNLGAWIFASLQYPSGKSARIIFRNCGACYLRKHTAGYCLAVPLELKRLSMQIRVDGYLPCDHTISTTARYIQWKLQLEEPDALVTHNYSCVEVIK
jgi:serine/threonine protein kinase